jgi:hypothetical protein
VYHFPAAYRGRPYSIDKNVVIFALIWLGEPFLILMFVKWVIHGSAAVYLLLVPWMLFGLIGVVRPNWILGMTRAFDKALEDAGHYSRNDRRPVFLR